MQYVALEGGFGAIRSAAISHVKIAKVSCSQNPDTDISGGLNAFYSRANSKSACLDSHGAGGKLDSFFERKSEITQSYGKNSKGHRQLQES